MSATTTPAARMERKGMGPWRGTKPAGYIQHPELFMKKCIGFEVSIRVITGAKWKGVLQEVHDNGDVVIRPAQELLYDEKDGDELDEKLLVKSDILWLRRHVQDADGEAAAAPVVIQPEAELEESPSPAKP